MDGQALNLPVDLIYLWTALKISRFPEFIFVNVPNSTVFELKAAKGVISVCNSFLARVYLLHWKKK